MIGNNIMLHTLNLFKLDNKLFDIIQLIISSNISLYYLEIGNYIISNADYHMDYVVTYCRLITQSHGSKCTLKKL